MQGERRQRGHLRTGKALARRHQVRQGRERVRLGNEEDSGGRDDDAATALRRQLPLHRVQEAAADERVHGEEEGEGPQTCSTRSSIEPDFLIRDLHFEIDVNSTFLKSAHVSESGEK